MKTTALILLTLLFMAFSCKKPTVSDLIECDPGWHPNADSTDCIPDTTSHQFSFSVDTIGIYGSYLNDVAIVDENNIWVVGNIETDSTSYNAAHWNGEEWEMILIDRIVDFDGVFAFNSDEIWFSDGCFVYYYNGSEFIRKWECDWQTYGPGQANAIWGTSSSDLYFVGLNGSIVHYDGVNFVQMDSGTDVDLKDIAGTSDGEYVVATGWGDMLESVVIVLNNGQWDTIYEDTQYAPTDSAYGTARAVSVHDETAYVTTMKGLWKYHLPTGESELMEWDYSSMNYFDFKVMDVYSPVDILLTGTGFTITHYNGASFYQDYQFINLFECVYVKGIDYDGQTAAVAGSLCWQHGIVIRGGRF